MDGFYFINTLGRGASSASPRDKLLGDSVQTLLSSNSQSARTAPPATCSCLSPAERPVRFFDRRIDSAPRQPGDRQTAGSSSGILTTSGRTSPLRPVGHNISGAPRGRERRLRAVAWIASEALTRRRYSRPGRPGESRCYVPCFRSGAQRVHMAGRTTLATLRIARRPNISVTISETTMSCCCATQPGLDRRELN